MGGKPSSVLIIGGGLAGLSAACELADKGFQVTLIEQRPYLGGRASSFYYQEMEEEVDLGQHVFMRCCTHYLEFLHKLGVQHKIYLQPSFKVKVFKDKRMGIIASSHLPAPFHLLPSFLNFPFYSGKDKFFILYALLHVLFSNRATADARSFYHWLKKRYQSEEAIEGFWNFIIRPALNEGVHQASAELGLMVFQEAFLKAHGADIGYATVGLSKLLEEAIEFIKRRGGEVLLGQRAKTLLLENDRVTGVALVPDQVLHGDLFLSALPPDALLQLLPEDWRLHPFFAPAAKLPWNPIVNIHIRYDRAVTEIDFAAFLGSSVQWIFNKSRILGRDAKEQYQYLCISLSDARQYIDMSREELLQLFSKELGELFPEARKARVLSFLVTKQRRATFSAAPEAQKYRLPHRTPIQNLWLAGDWTATGWPSTMEGAVRSGIACSQEILRSYPSRK